MPTQLQFRRGNTYHTSAFTGAVGELTVDTDKQVVVVHDGITQGGYPLASETFVQAAFDAANTVISGSADDTWARNQANTALDVANNAYDEANSAHSLATTKLDVSGGTINGDLTVTGNTTIFQNTTANNSTANNLIVNNTLYSGLATRSATPLPNLIAQFTSNSSSYVQVNAQNLDPNGSADFVVTADVGTDITFFIDMGMQNSGDTSGTLKPLDGYLIVQGNTGQIGGNLVVGTSTSGQNVRVIAGGLEDGNTVVTFDTELNSTFTGNVVPSIDNTQFLGTPSKRWHSLYVGPGSVNLGSVVLSESSGQLQITGASDIVLVGSNIPSSTGISNQANAAFVTANAAFDVANTKFNSSGGTISGDVNVNGNLNVTGTTLYANVENVLVKDNIITVNSNVTGSPFLNGGLEINRGDLPNTSIIWNESDKFWEFTNDGSNYSKIADSDILNVAFNQANTGVTIAQSSYDRANNIAIVNPDGSDLNKVLKAAVIGSYWSEDLTPLAFNQANTGVSLAQQAFNRANTDVTTINTDAGIYGGSTAIPVITLSSNGRVSNITNTIITTGTTITQDSSTDSSFFPLFTNTPGGLISDATVSYGFIYNPAQELLNIGTLLSLNGSTGTVTAVDVNTTSDAQYKENVENITNPMEVLNSINGVSFNWKDSGNKSYGVIAQELQKVLPELVKQDDRGLSVSYIPLIAILLEAVKDLQKQIDTLKK